jgi:hypothetical protein
MTLRVWLRETEQLEQLSAEELLMMEEEARIQLVCDYLLSQLRDSGTTLLLTEQGQSHPEMDPRDTRDRTPLPPEEDAEEA